MFILCAQGLFALIKQAERIGNLHGICICVNSPVISHLFFADDCFLFFIATKSEAHILKNILTTYEAATGQPIILPKSKI